MNILRSSASQMWKIGWCIVLVYIFRIGALVGSLRPPLPGERLEGGDGPAPPQINETLPCPKVDAVKNRIDMDVKMFYVEHEVSEKDARAHIRKIDVDHVFDGLCNKCTKKEMEYCGEKVINDHCCCDRSELEHFPYLPHTCYFGDEKCNLVASHCEEYEYLRDCCCSKHLIVKWRSKLIKSSGNKIKQIRILLWTSTMILFALQY